MPLGKGGTWLDGIYFFVQKCDLSEQRAQPGPHQTKSQPPIGPRYAPTAPSCSQEGCSRIDTKAFPQESPRWHEVELTRRPCGLFCSAPLIISPEVLTAVKGKWHIMREWGLGIWNMSDFISLLNKDELLQAVRIWCLPQPVSNENWGSFLLFFFIFITILRHL